MDGLLLLLEEVTVHRNRKNMNYKSVYCCAIWEMEPSILSLSSTKIRIQMVFKSKSSYTSDGSGPGRARGLMSRIPWISDHRSESSSLRWISEGPQMPLTHFIGSVASPNKMNFEYFLGHFVPYRIVVVTTLRCKNVQKSVSKLLLRPFYLGSFGTHSAFIPFILENR